MLENVTGMDFTPAGTISQLQNTTFLTNVFMTTLLVSLGLEGIKTIIGEIFSLNTLPTIKMLNRGKRINVSTLDFETNF